MQKALDSTMRAKLRALARRFEISSFSQGDPSSVLRRYISRSDVEIAAFVAAMFSFGRRDQFIPKFQRILDTADKFGGPIKWIQSGLFDKDFASPDGDATRKYYRFYSYADVYALLRGLASIVAQYGTLGDAVRIRYESLSAVDKQTPGVLGNIISSLFTNCSMVPHGENSANKRVHMFLRWMVRQDSPVDLGIWDWASPSVLLIPLDVHVVVEATKLGLIPANAKADAKTARRLTSILREVWPDDPCRGDYALFGLGVEH